MAMIVTCPCGRQLRLDEQFVGKRVRCPICQQIFVAAGSAGGDFQIENTIPPSEPEPTPAPLREAPTIRSPREPEPTIFDLAPPYESESARPASRTRPPSRPTIREDEGEREEMERIRRKIRRPSGSRGKLRPGTWPITKALDILAGAMLLAVTSMILFSPHYAWYFAWLVPFVCFYPVIGVIYLTCASGYLYFAHWPPSLSDGLVIYGPCILLLVAEFALRGRRKLEERHAVPA